MKKLTRIIISAILALMLCCGVVLTAIGGGTIIKDNKYVKTAEKTLALVDTVQLNDGSRKYILTYNVDGENFYPDYDFRENRDDYIGKDIYVYYTKGAPQDIFIETAEQYFIFLYTGLGLMLLSIALLAVIYVPIISMKYLIKNGKKELVKINEIIDVIGGYKILCDSTKIRGKNAAPYKSKTLKTAPPKKAIHSAVTVYYHPKHKRLYYIDTNTIKNTEAE